MVGADAEVRLTEIGDARPDLPRHNHATYGDAGRDAAARSDARRDDAAPGLAVHVGAGTAARIRWCDRVARARGVRPGQTVAAARARCADLRTAPLDERAMREARREAIGIALRHTPRVAVAGDTRLWAEPAPLGEPLEAWGEALAESLAWAGARVGIGAWAAAAHAAAQVAVRCRVLDDSTGFLDTAPLTALELDAATRARLAGLGVRRVGALRRLDPAELGARLGPAVARAWRWASGDDPRGPYTPAPARAPEVLLQFDEVPIATLDPLLFLLRGALASLLRAPRARGEGAAAIGLTLTVERGPDVEVILRAGQPIADETAWLTLAQARLERLPRDPRRGEAFVHGLTLAIHEAGPVAAPTGALFGDEARDPAAREVALARLGSRFGEAALARASSVPAAHPLARAAWSRDAPRPGAALPWRGQEPPAPVEAGRVVLGGRARRVLRRAPVERALRPWWTLGQLVIERLVWAEVEGPLLVLLRQRRGDADRWEAVAWVD